MTDRPLPPVLRAALDARDDGGALADVWSRLPAAPLLPDGAPSDDEAWDALTARLDQPPRLAADRAPRASTRQAPRRWRWPAAVAALVVAVSAVWALRPASITAPAGEVVAALLPDGSRVELAPGSEVRYARGFSALWGADTRRLALDGEAFFDVVTDSRPFVVETHDAAVTVLGTRFVVRARAGDLAPGTRVVVEEGSVRVDGAEQSVVLAPGQAARVAADVPLSAEPSSALRATAWRRGGFAVENAPLADVLAEVERRFGVVAEAGPGVPLDLPMTLYYGADADADVVIHDLSLAAGLRYTPVQGGFRVGSGR